jgi:hypothetical protein
MPSAPRLRRAGRERHPPKVRSFILDDGNGAPFGKNVNSYVIEIIL